MPTTRKERSSLAAKMAMVAGIIKRGFDITQ
jgi:hypothetical protein